MVKGWHVWPSGVGSPGRIYLVQSYGDKVSQHASNPEYGSSHLEWNLVRCPDLSANASFVSMSSPSICAISTTMSSTRQSSYFVKGRTLAGGDSGLARFGLPMGTLSAALPPSCCASEFLRLLGEVNWVEAVGVPAVRTGALPGAVEEIVGKAFTGSEDFSSCRAVGFASDVGSRLRPNSAADRSIGTAATSSVGVDSVGEYCVPASMPTYRFGGGGQSEGEAVTAALLVPESEDDDLRRCSEPAAALADGDWWGEEVGA